MTDTQTDQTDHPMLALLADSGGLRAVLAAALDCIVAMDAEAACWSGTPPRAHLRWTAAEAIGREMAELIVPPALRERHRAGLARFVAGGDPVLLDQRIEITAVVATGRRSPWS